MAKKPYSITIDQKILEQLRNVAYWDRTSVSSLIEDAVKLKIITLVAERGKPYTVRPGGIHELP